MPVRLWHGLKIRRAFAVILEAAGISWTLSSEAVAYDGVNYGLFYDDIMLAKIVLKHAQAAKKLGVKKIVLGECGHAHKALTVIGDRILTGDLNIPRESAMTLLRDIVMSGKIKFDPSRNDFPRYTSRSMQFGKVDGCG